MEGLAAGGHHRLGLDRLLVKLRPKTVPPQEPAAADRREAAGRRCLPLGKPFEHGDTGVECLRLRCPAAGGNQRLARPGVLIGDHVLEPRPVGVGVALVEREQPVGERLPGGDGEPVALEPPEIFLEADDRQRPATRARGRKHRPHRGLEQPHREPPQPLLPRPADACPERHDRPAQAVV